MGSMSQSAVQAVLPGEVCKPFTPTVIVFIWKHIFWNTWEIMATLPLSACLTLIYSSANQLFGHAVNWVWWCLGLCWDIVRGMIKRFLPKSAWARWGDHQVRNKKCIQVKVSNLENWTSCRMVTIKHLWICLN